MFEDAVQPLFKGMVPCQPTQPHPPNPRHADKECIAKDDRLGASIDPANKKAEINSSFTFYIKRMRILSHLFRSKYPKEMTSVTEATE